MIKRTFFLMLMVLTGLPVLQAQSYQLQVMQGQAYADITDATYEIPDHSPYFGNINTKPQLTFNAFGSQYDLSVNVYVPLKQGYLYFDNNNRSTTIYAAKGDFVKRPGDTSVFSFKTDETAGNRKFILQWKNMGIKNGTVNDFINFQVWLYETSGVIEFRYGQGAVSNGLWEGGNGPTIGLLEMDASFSTIYRQLWLSGNPASPQMVSSGGVIRLNSVPANGTVYRFTPATTTSANELKEQPAEVSVYPTLISEAGKVYVQGADAEQGFYYSVTDMQGRDHTGKTFSNSHEISTAHLPAGLYFVHIQNSYSASIHKICRQ